MILVVLAGIAVVTFLVVRKARRVRMLAGLNADKPVYFAEPPRRHTTNLNDHRL